MDMFHYQTCGLENVFLANGYKVTEYGGERAVAIHNLRGLHKVIADSLINKLEPLTGREFRFLRLEMDLSQSMLGELFSISDQAIAKWEKGQNGISGPAGMLIRVLAKEKIMNQGGHVAGLIEKLAELDRQAVERLTFQETEEGWQMTA